MVLPIHGSNIVNGDGKIVIFLRSLFSQARYSHQDSIDAHCCVSFHSALENGTFTATINNSSYLLASIDISEVVKHKNLFFFNDLC